VGTTPLKYGDRIWDKVNKKKDKKILPNNSTARRKISPLKNLIFSLH